MCEKRVGRRHTGTYQPAAFGNMGTGTPFLAGCIANALLDRDVPVLMTNFPSVLNRLTGVFTDTITPAVNYRRFYLPKFPSAALSSVDAAPLRRLLPPCR